MMFTQTDTNDLVAQFLANGGQITKVATKVARGNDGKEFVHTRESLRKRKEHAKRAS